MRHFFIPKNELNILLSLALLTVFSLYLIPVYSVIEAYNQKVKEEQLLLENEANFGKPTFRFSNCFIASSIPFWQLLFWLQIFTNPIIYLCLRRNNFTSFLVSIFFTFLTLLSYLLWSVRTQEVFSLSENFPINDLSPFEKVFYKINNLEIFLLAIISVFFILQIFILLRFVIERFQVKISFR